MAENWTLANPIDHTKIGDVPAEIRNVKTLVVSGMARIFFQASAPTTKYDGTAFAVDDNGSIWVDSGDNTVNILTDYSGPTWTDTNTATFAALLAAARTFAFANATLTLQNTTHEDGDGGRDSKFIAKGEQSGGEVTTLGYLEFSHEGASDDQKGQLIIKLNDGDDADAPSKQPIGFQSTGKIDVANSLSVLDEDNMASDDAEVIATQQSVKAYVDTQDAVADDDAFGTLINSDSDVNALVKTSIYKTTSDGFIMAYKQCTAGHVQELQCYRGVANPPTTLVQAASNGNTLNVSVMFPVRKNQYWKIVSNTAGDPIIYWQPIGSGECQIQ